MLERFYEAASRRCFASSHPDTASRPLSLCAAQIRFSFGEPLEFLLESDPGESADPRYLWAASSPAQARSKIGPSTASRGPLVRLFHDVQLKVVSCRPVAGNWGGCVGEGINDAWPGALAIPGSPTLEPSRREAVPRASAGQRNDPCYRRGAHPASCERVHSRDGAQPRCGCRCSSR
jgi:hypothetical protein